MNREKGSRVKKQATSVQRQLLLPSDDKVLERIGRLKERSHGIHRYYDIEVPKKDQIATDIRWSFSRSEEADERYSGRYYLRTSRDDLDEKSLWELYITVLAYHLLSGIRHRLREHGYLARWSTIRAQLSTHIVATISMKTDRGGRISIRTASSPEVAHGDIYRALGLRLNPFPVRRSEGR